MNQDDKLLELAIELRLLTRRQADFVRQDLALDPDEGVQAILLRRRYLTGDQLQGLQQTLLKGGTSLPPATRPPATAQHDSPTVRTQPAASAAPATAPPASAASPSPAPAAAPATAPAATYVASSLLDYLRMARAWQASDLHLSVGRSPFVRMGGEIRYLDAPPLTPELAESLNFAGLNDEQRALLEKHLALDFALDIPNLGRYRCNVFRQRLGWDGSYRIVRDKIPSFEELGLPPVAKTMTEYHQGMVLITGPSGSGKTTTVAAMLDLVNRGRTDHIITVEDPIEYVHAPKKCQVTQREVGRHTDSFAKALRAALREDPDIILVGELRDHETISIAISAAETGHLVFGTLHTGSAPRTVARVLDVFPPSQQQQICTMISESIRGIFSQQLIPRADNQGVALALEVLVVTSGVAQIIREGKTYQLGGIMQAGKRFGMKLMDDSLMELFQNKIISGAEAYSRAENKAPFESVKNQS